jgi:hypothetical protein
MVKGISRTALAVLALVGLVALGAAAQSFPTPLPEAFVHGQGAIAIVGPTSTIAAPNQGVFNINVSRTNGVLYGGFNYVEMTPAGVRVVAIASKKLIELRIVGNHAVIRAEGAISDKTNTRLACLMLEVDDNADASVATPDRLHIRADGCMLPVIFYDKGGDVVKGDIVVWKKPIGFGYAKGSGAILVPKPPTASATALPTIGNFQFAGETSSAGVQGMISYAEISPVATGPISMMLARINVPKIATLTIDGNKATLAGPGVLNGKPVFVTVVAVDNAKTPPPADCPAGTICVVPDRFLIEAKLTPDPTSVTLYHAEGPLIRGDIVVGMYK